MSSVRSPVLSGSWYPGAPEALAATVDGFLAAPAPPAGMPAGRPVVAVAPHAGYAYSGPTAGLVLGAVGSRLPARVVILAPNHRRPLDRIALSSARAFATPLGEVPLDTDAVAALGDLPAFVVDDAAHAEEHAVEIQLPFLQRLRPAPPPRILPLLVPELTPDRRRSAAAALGDLAGPDTLFLVSTDFTHYGAGFGFVPFHDDVPAALERLDAGACLRVLAADGPGLRVYGRETGITMCGLEAAALALEGVVPPGHESVLLGYARSGDRDGDYTRSVSYAALLICVGPGESGPS